MFQCSGSQLGVILTPRWPSATPGDTLVLERWGQGACAADIPCVEVRDAAKHATMRRTVCVTKNYPAERSLVPRLGDPENNTGTYSNGETGLGRHVPLQAALAVPPPTHHVCTDISGLTSRHTEAWPRGLQLPARKR